jgi:glycosyltransferase involved in cell wall biosynthesis
VNRPRAARRVRALRGRLGADSPDDPGDLGSDPGAPRLSATLETTNLGPVLDRRVQRARRQMLAEADDDYTLVRDHLDPLYYLLRHPQLLDRPQVDLVRHFLSHGVAQGASPEPNFSMRHYLADHPERGEGAEVNPYVAWRREGREAGEIADPAPGITELAPVLGLAPGEVADRLAERRQDLVDRLRTGTLGAMVAKAAEIEPLIGQTWGEITRPVLLPFSRKIVTDQMHLVHTAQEQAGFRRARLVLVVNRPRWGGGRRMEGHIAHALARQVAPEDIVVLYTEHSGSTPEGRFPAGVREIDLAPLVADMDHEAAMTALVVLLRSFGADAIVNINSRLFYGAMRSYGKALAHTERIFLTFFCHEQVATGAWFGWSIRYFYRTFDQVAGVLADSEHLARELVDRHRVTGRALEKVHVLRAPVDPALPEVAAPPAAEERRPQVFWAGRFERQKKVGLLGLIARQLPDVDFRVWGDRADGRAPGGLPDNVTLEGRYDHITDVPLHEADAWLYTSGWDGVPSQLLEVAVTGIPIVGTLVGGTGEVLREGEAWPVVADTGPAPYVLAIREVLADPAAARTRAHALRERMLAERTEDAFADHVTRLLLPAGKEATG